MNSTTKNQFPQATSKSLRKHVLTREVANMKRVKSQIPFIRALILRFVELQTDLPSNVRKQISEIIQQLDTINGTPVITISVDNFNLNLTREYLEASFQLFMDSIMADMPNAATKFLKWRELFEFAPLCPIGLIVQSPSTGSEDSGKFSSDANIPLDSSQDEAHASDRVLKEDGAMKPGPSNP
ncbi:hypothetical protein HA402_004221 [Bradysia odoriphaga]|nr:hypothetical protein HA402_004221 [Bradysia odoriphaga]